MMKKLVMIFVLIITSITIPNAFAEDKEIDVFVKYHNGDPVDFSEMEFIVFQDFETSPFLEQTAESNPQKFLLANNHRYQIEVYVNNMYAGVGYIDVSEKQKIEITIPLSGGLQANVFYDDGKTPVSDATIVIKSDDGKEWRRAQTNEYGDTPRFWIQSTNKKSDYYIIDVYIGENLVKKLNQVKVHPGIPKDEKIILNIPETIKELITVTFYESANQKLVDGDEKYKAILRDKEERVIETSNVNIRGQAFFANIKSGEYTIELTLKDENLDFWPKTSVLLIGNQNEFNIFKEPDIKEIEESVTDIESCNCVAFRFDDVQDYWLTDVQIAVMKYFADSDIPLTVGIIADSIGNDQKITEFLTEKIKSDELEIANHGIGNEPFTDLTKEEQKQRLNESTEMIFEKFNVKPKVFIPPQNRINQDTIEAVKESQITHISASLIHGEQPPFPLKNQVVYRYPEIATTGEYDPEQNLILGINSSVTFQSAMNGLNNYGFAVITMHPQEFSTIKDGVYIDKVNQNQIEQLNMLIQDIQDNGFSIVPISEINLDSNIKIPDWVKDSAGWWANGEIDAETFVTGIQYLVKEKIIQVPEPEYSQQPDTIIPDWVKDSSGRWANGEISGTEFVKGIEYLIANGIIRY